LHKFFAKTSFLGKNIIYLPHCHSTNTLLLQYVKDGEVAEGTVIVADYQTGGRGQRGNTWQSAEGENLLFSVYLRPQFIEPQWQYLINVLTAQTIVETIDKWGSLCQAEINWPKDIFLNDKKLGGILVETLISGRTLEHAVIGMGLNLNQRDFGEMNATSLAREGISLDRWELLEAFLLRLEENLTWLVNRGEEALRRSYLKRLRWIEEEHQFQLSSSGEIFFGTIIGIDEFGRLKVSLSDTEKTFDIQQIKFIA